MFCVGGGGGGSEWRCKNTHLVRAHNTCQMEADAHHCIFCPFHSVSSVFIRSFVHPFIHSFGSFLISSFASSFSQLRLSSFTGRLVSLTLHSLADLCL